MRQIEAKMNQALRNFQNWSSGNTTVTSTREEMKVFLHGNHIATVNKATMTINLFDGGWQSNTTKSRLNALLDEFTHGGYGVFQKDFVWYVSDRLDGSVRPFFSGMTV